MSNCFISEVKGGLQQRFMQQNREPGGANSSACSTVCGILARGKGLLRQGSPEDELFLNWNDAEAVQVGGNNGVSHERKACNMNLNFSWRASTIVPANASPPKVNQE